MASEYRAVRHVPPNIKKLEEQGVKVFVGQVMTTQDVASLFEITPDAVHKLVERGVIVAQRRGPGRRLLFDTGSVAAEWRRRLKAKEKYWHRPRPPLNRDEEGRKFMERVEVDSDTGCWEWTGSFVAGDYGQFYIASWGVQVGAHVASHILFKGDVPKGKHVDHLCVNPHCVNPDHLEIVAPAENVRRSTLRREMGLPDQFFLRDGLGNV